MKNIIIENVRELNGIYKELKGKLEDIKQVTSKFNRNDLKLHHSYHYLCELVEEGLLTNQQAESLFTHICDIELDNFEEWEKENLNYVSREYINGTSSFYYLTDSYGEMIETYYINDLLQGKDVDIVDYMERLPDNIYNALIEESEINLNKMVETVNSELEEEFINELISYVFNFFEEISLDLELLKEIAEETKKAYSYLNDFKSKSNEIELTKKYLVRELSEILAEETASDIFKELKFELDDNLNNFDYINATHVVNNIGTYSIEFKIDNKTLIIDTDISINTELSKMYIEQITTKINESLQSKL